MYDSGCEFWQLKKNWTIKMLLDYGYLEGENCVTCQQEKNCLYRLMIEKELSKNENSERIS